MVSSCTAPNRCSTPTTPAPRSGAPSTPWARRNRRRASPRVSSSIRSIVECAGMTPLDPLAPFRLDGRVAIVTGASSGLGARFARVLQAAGADVVLAARRVDRIEALASELGPTAVPCDVRDDAQCQALVDATLERPGQVDVLVNNAGVGVTVPAEDEPIEH